MHKTACMGPCHCATNSVEELFGRKLLRAVLHISNPPASPLCEERAVYKDDSPAGGNTHSAVQCNKPETQSTWTLLMLWKCQVGHRERSRYWEARRQGSGLQGSYEVLGSWLISSESAGVERTEWT